MSRDHPLHSSLAYRSLSVWLCFTTPHAAVAASDAIGRFSWAEFGLAYAFLLVNVVLAAVFYFLSRWQLILSPKPATKLYCAAVAIVIATYLIATVVENEILAPEAARLPYESLPNFALIGFLHAWSYWHQEPRMLAVVMSSLLAGLIVGAVAVVAGWVEPLPAQWVVGLTLAGILAYVILQSVYTKRSFLKAKSIYVASKETGEPSEIPETRPWLGLTQWVALVMASMTLAVLAQLLDGASVSTLLAADVFGKSLILIGTTIAIAALPASGYWLMRHAWMPELTRLVWVIWLMIGFAMTYGSYLGSLDRV